MTTYVICNRCGKPKLPVYSDGTNAPTGGFCQCQNETGWGEALLRQTPLDWRDAELARLRAELEQAKRERDEARKAHAAIEYAYKMATGVLPFDPHDELNQLRVSNRYMLEELTRLRADRQAGKE